MNKPTEIAYPNIPIKCAFACEKASGDPSIKVSELVLKPEVSEQLHFISTPGSRGNNMTLQGFEWQGPTSRNGLVTNVFLELKELALKNPALLENDPGFRRDFFQAMVGCILCKTCSLKGELKCNPLLIHQAPHPQLFVIPIVDADTLVPRIEYTF